MLIEGARHSLDSIATFFGHLPWLGVYVGKIPAATGNLNKLLNHCVACAIARVQRGSKTKDLFHYLVSMSSSSRVDDFSASSC